MERKRVLRMPRDALDSHHRRNDRLHTIIALYTEAYSWLMVASCVLLPAGANGETDSPRAPLSNSRRDKIYGREEKKEEGKASKRALALSSQLMCEDREVQLIL